MKFWKRKQVEDETVEKSTNEATAQGTQGQKPNGGRRSDRIGIVTDAEKLAAR